MERTPLDVRLAASDADVEAAQALRYRVFYEEMNARASAEVEAQRRDFDGFDQACDHLIVCDPARAGARPYVVGTYRLMRRSNAARHRGFYSEQEFDLGPLKEQPGEILELGRSCVDPAYRARGVMQLLWSGISQYLTRHDIGLMFGCASFHGTDPDDIEPALSYLYHYHLAPVSLRARAWARNHVTMGVIPRAHVDARAGLGALPPLMKGYVRLGAFVGEGAVVDRDFNTIDVCIIVKTDRLSERYRRHYRPSGTA